MSSSVDVSLEMTARLERFWYKKYTGKFFLVFQPGAMSLRVHVIEKDFGSVIAELAQLLKPFATRRNSLALCEFCFGNFVGEHICFYFLDSLWISERRRVGEEGGREMRKPKFKIVSQFIESSFTCTVTPSEFL